MIKVKIKAGDPTHVPAYQTPGSSGSDLKAVGHHIISPHRWKLIPTGIFLEIPEGYEAQVRSRSGLALKQGIFVLNSPGSIDADYRGEIGVILYNASSNQVEIKDGDRIAQLVFAPVVQAQFELVNQLSTTERGAGGFGSTGVKGD